MKLFVYGTLRKGLWNNVLLTHLPCLGRAFVANASMYSLGGFPCVVMDGGEGVYGEVYEIDDLALTNCDRLEGYYGDSDRHRNFYDRRTVECVLLDGDGETTVETFIYTHDRGNPAQRIEGGDWLEHYEARGI